MWDLHVHVAKVLDWDPSPGEAKKYLKSLWKSTNNNDSVMCTDIHGFLYLNELMTICKSSGDYIYEVTGREVPTSLFKFKSRKPFIAKVRQQHNQGVVMTSNPNNPESEMLAIQGYRNNQLLSPSASSLILKQISFLSKTSLRPLLTLPSYMI